MSLTRLVTDIIIDRGSGTVDDLVPELPKYTRRQLLDALHNARAAGWLVCRQVRATGAGGRITTAPSIHYPANVEPSLMYTQLVARSSKPKGPLIASVFDLGNPKPESAWPRVEGTVYQLMGSWEEELASNDSRKAAGKEARWK